MSKINKFLMSFILLLIFYCELCNFSYVMFLDTTTRIEHIILVLIIFSILNIHIIAISKSGVNTELLVCFIRSKISIFLNLNMAINLITIASTYQNTLILYVNNFVKNIFHPPIILYKKVEYKVF